MYHEANKSDSRRKQGGHDWLHTQRRVQTDETTTSRRNSESDIRQGHSAV